MVPAPDYYRDNKLPADPVAGGLPEAGTLDLKAFLRAALLVPAPAPVPIKREQPVERRWHPELGTTPAVLPLLDRHPEFHPLDGTDPPVRRIKRLSRSVKVGWRGVFQSMKMGRPMRHLSGIEREALRRCEVDPEVASFVEHPAAMRFGRRRFTPSLYVHGPSGSRFVACCQEATASRPENEARWTEIGAALGQTGYGFEVFTELHARVRPRADNVADLLRTRWDEPVDPDQERAAVKAAWDGKTIGTLRESAGLSRAQFLQLVRRHVLAVNLDWAMTDEAAVTPGPAAAHAEAPR